MATKAINRRWSENQKQFWKFTYSNKDHVSIGAVLDSGADENPGCNIRFHFLGHTLIIELPKIIGPWRRKVKAMWDDATIQRFGRDWYYDEHPREYGFSYSNGFLQVFLGAQTHDSETQQSWCKFLPWTQWRFIRFSLYDLAGKHFWTEMASDRKPGMDGFRLQMEAEERVPKMAFLFEDFDGKQITAITHIEEREYKFGEGWFKWLSVFRKPKIYRSLSIKFSDEVGPEKGSWKGGTIGHGIDMLAGELHQQAFKRYCQLEHRSKYRRYRIKYIGPSLAAA